MILLRRVSGLVPMWFLAACVTINVYFPQAAAETAAKTIVRDVLGTGQGGAEPAPAAEPDKGSRRDGIDAPVLGWVLHVLVAPAYAAADININTPAINALRASLKQRQSQLRPYFDSGALGLTRDGLVAIRDLQAIPLRDRNRVKKLVADENRDRSSLYREIARANGHPEWEKDIRKTFAGVWIQESPRGTWYQVASGAWKRK